MANKGPYILYDEKLGKLDLYVKSSKTWKQYYFPREKKKLECQIVDEMVKSGASISEVQKFYKQCVKNSTLWKSYTSEKSQDSLVQKAPEKKHPKKAPENGKENENLGPDAPDEKKDNVVISKIEIKDEPIEILSEDISSVQKVSENLLLKKAPENGKEDENLSPDFPNEIKDNVVISKIEIKDEPIEISSEDVSIKSTKLNEADQDSDQDLDELGGKQYHHVAILQCKSSRIINTLFYDHKERVLIITFREPKKCSEAYKAPASFFDDFVKSSSKARFYNTHFEDPTKKKSKLEKKGVFSIRKEKKIFSESLKKYQALISPLKKN